MALVVKDRVQETSTTTGTGTLTLDGAVTGFQTFSTAIGNTNTTYYAISSESSEFEVGIGTVGAGTLARTTILASSNGGLVVTLSAGIKNVFCTQPAVKSLFTDASGNAIALGTPASATLTNATGLPISSGVSGLGTNVATFLATPSSANLASAVTNETGSGALVFGTSPTLVTPVLGTPSSGNLANCTFPTLNQSTSGNAATATTATNLSGGTVNGTSGSFTDLLVGRSSASTDINTANDTGSFSARGSASTVASMSFHRTSAFAINVGLSTANNFVIGGWSATSNAFSMSSGGNLTMTGNVTAFSDERLKTNWRDLQPDFIERLAEVKHGIYDRTDQKLTQLGVGAQSLRPIMEHAILENEEGKLSVSYGNAALVACVKLAQRVVALEEKLKQYDKLVPLLIENIKKLSDKVKVLEGK